MLFLLAFLLLRLVFWFTTFPNPDEAYYWLWGQHPALSYYDHPPLQAWIQGAFTALLGRSDFVLRLPNLISNGVLFYTYYRILRYLYGKSVTAHFWLLVLLLLASPLYFLFLALAWHDHLLITFTLIAAYCFIRFLDSYLADRPGETRYLYAAAVAIALSLLCKYNAVFVPLGFLAAVIADKRLRPLLGDSRIYLASLVAASGLLPIVLWNFSNDWQSFHYYVDRSVNTGSFSLKVAPFLNFVLFSILTVSPLHCFGFWRSFRQRDLPIRTDTVYRSVAFWVFLVSTVILIGISLISAALYYWNITAYLLLFPLLPGLFLPKTENRSEPKFLSITRDRRWFLASQYYGLLFATLLVVHYSFLPISALFSPQEDPDSRMLFGWPEVAATVSQQAKELGGQPWLVTTDYRSASALAYQLQDKTVTAISDRRDQFDMWYPDQTVFQGRNAVILADDWHPLTPDLLAQFKRTTSPISVPVRRFGVWIKNYYVLKGYQFQPSPATEANQP